MKIRITGIKNELTILVGLLIVFGVSLTFQYSPLDDMQLFGNKINWLQDIRNITLIFSNTLDAGLVQTPFYRPVLMLSFMVDAITGNGSPFTYHLTNLLIHILVSLGLYRAFIILLKDTKSALFWTLFFSLHPMLTSAVTWIPGRNDTLITLFGMVSIYFLIRYLFTLKNHWLILNIIFLLLAVFTKEQMILLPIIFALIIIFFNLGKWEIFPLSVIWFFSLSFFFIIRSYIVVGNLTINIPDGVTYLNNFISAFIITIGKLIIPIHQSPMPSFQYQSILPGCLIIFAIGFSIYKWGIHDRKLFNFGLSWFMLMVSIPLVWGTVQDEFFEHRLYFPLLGFTLMLSQINVIQNFLHSNNKFLKNFTIVIILLFAVRTHIRTYVYQDKFTFGHSAVEESPFHARSYKLMGDVYRSVGKPEFAVDYYNIALEINPESSDMYNNRGDIYLKQNQYFAAIEDFSRALVINPGNLLARNNRSVAYFFIGEYDKSREDIQIVLSEGGRVNPDFLEKLNQVLSHH